MSNSLRPWASDGSSTCTFKSPRIASDVEKIDVLSSRLLKSSKNDCVMTCDPGR